MPRNNYTPRISFVTGIVNPGDAISEALIADICALDRLGVSQRRNLDLQIYCRESSYKDTRVQVVNDWRDVLRDEHFRTSDLYYFHYGIFSEMHHLMHHARRDARLALYFHNVTQPQYCPPEHESLIHASYQQIRNFAVADSILAASAFSARQLEGYGIASDIRVVPLFGPNAPESLTATAPSIDTTRPLRLLYCGRFVRSKGVDLLLAALDRIKTSLARPIELTLAGQTQFSDAKYIASLDESAASLKPGIAVTFAFDLAPDAIRTLFADADAFVLPSMHEGFGMTVAEAMLAGTPVICSDAGALPEVSGGFGLTFASGDSAGLASALQAFAAGHSTGMIQCDRGALLPEVWRQAMAEHAQTFLRASYIDRIAETFDTLLQPTANWSESARQALADADAFEPGDTLAQRFDSAVMDALADQISRINGSAALAANPPGHAKARPAVRSVSGPDGRSHLDSLCVEIQIEERNDRSHWLGPAHRPIARTFRMLHQLAGKRAHFLGRTRHPIARGNAARNRKDWQGAVANYTKALEIRPELAGIWVQLGHALKESGALAEARQAYARAEKLLPQNADLNLQIGHLQKLRGNIADAADFYRRALLYNPANTNAARELTNLGYFSDVGRIRAFRGIDCE